MTAIYIGGALSTTLTGEAKAMMEDSMAWMDNFFDPKENLIFEVQSDAAMNHETLESVWYAVGLLARNGNQGQDVSHAEGIITRVIDDQYKDPADIWFGVYTKEPEEPYVGTAPYPATRYGSWDPNWYDFVGTAFVTIYEEFGPILSASTKEYMLESMVNSSIGNSRRGGDVDGDNLWPAYSNPAIMRAATTTWTGVKTGNKTMQAEGEGYAQQIIDLWDLHKTLSEFNSPTYTGISLFGLTLWGKYMPKSSILAQRGPDIFRGTFSTVAQLWHAGMRNLAGPWDRSYSFNMQTSLGHLSLLLAPIIGREESGLRQNPWIMSHARDWCWASLIAVHAEYFTSLVPQNVKKMLKEFSPHTWRGQVYYPPFDLETRNITTWLGEKLMIGAQSYHTTSSNGPDDNNEQFHPAVAQWTYNNGDIGWLDVSAFLFYEALH